MASSAATTTLAPPTYVLASNGPLTHFFVPPSSCLETTTFDGTNYFLGYQSALGTDEACYPPVIASPTSTSTIVSNANAITLQYWSPGLCPYGWTYAMSYNGPGIPVTGTASPSTVSFEGFAASTVTYSPDNTAYICCPTGFNIGVTSYGSGSAQGAYPICTLYDGAIYAGWSMQPGWPTVKPESHIQLYSKVPAASDATCESFTVRASGIVVAWHATDTFVASAAQYVLTDHNNGQMPPWP
jgi:hypothetical protein